MNSPRFIHLRLHSEFSITDGIVRLDDAIKRAIQDKMPAVGMSDLMNIFGMVKFYKGCRDKGIKPIVSCDIWLENEDDRDKPYRMMLTVKNRQGYGRLCELLADAYTHNQYRGRAEIKRAWLENGDNSGLICLSGAHLGDVGQALLQGQRDEARRRAEYWERCFPDSFYLELQRLDNPQVEHALQASLWLAGETSLPVVATHPIQFMGRTISRPMKLESASPKASPWATSAGRAVSRRTNTSCPPSKCWSASPTFPKRWKTRWKSPAAVISVCSWARTTCRNSPPRMA